MAIIESIVSQHCEEAAFLWLLRDDAVAAPHYSLQDLSDLDNRVEAHLDGLRIAGDEGWPLLAEGLQQQENGEVFAAAVIALEGDEPSRMDEVFAAVEATPETLRGFVSAIGWVPRDRLRGKIAGLLASASPLWRRAGIAGCAIHRVDCGRHFTAAVEDPDPALRARALRAVGEVARQDLGPAIQDQFRSDDVVCRFWAAWSSVLLGNRGDGVAALKAIADSEPRFAERACGTLLRVLDPQECQHWLKRIAEIPERRRDLIKGCGVAGYPIYIAWLIQQMQASPDLARVAGESISLMTGVDIAYEDLEGDQPEGFESGPTEDPANDDVSMDPDEDLPWPDPQRIQAWWDANKDRFASGTRYLVGQPVSEAHCRGVLRTGFQWQRRAAALELALMKPGEPLFEVRMPGFRQ